MLYVVLKDGQEIVWHIDSDAKRTYNIRDQAAEVSFVQADGDELHCIQQCFENLPSVNCGPVRRWYGCLAQLVAGNLPISFKKE